MSNRAINLSRNQIADIVNNDPEAIRAFEELLKSNGGAAWVNIDFTDSDLADIETRPHSALQLILGADETDSDTGKDKHVSNNQLKVNADRFTVVDESTTITAGDSQIILADASLGSFTINLPTVAAGLLTKARYIIKKIDSTANEVTVDPDAAETIDGESTMIINTQYDAMQIVPHGSEWSII